MESVPALSGRIKFTREQIELIKSTVAVGATDGELELFKQVCEARGLNPFLKQIYCIQRTVKRDDKYVKVMVHQTGIDGFRLIAQRTGKYAGQLGPFFTEDGVTWVDAWIKESPPAAAKVGILRKDFKEPVWAMARYSAYCPRDNQTGKLSPTGVWKTCPEGQTAKCAEALGFRRAFPEELSGLYTNDEMQQAGEPTHYDAEIKVVDEHPREPDLPSKPVTQDELGNTVDGEADGKPGVVEQEDPGEHFGQEPQGKHRPISEMFAAPDSTAPDAPADAAEKAMIEEMWKRCKAPFAKKLAALQAVGFTTIETLRKDQIEACAEALQGL